MNKYKHIIYNPHIRSLQNVIDSEPIDDSWQFVRCQPVTQYEWVAIFEKWDSWADKVIENGEKQCPEDEIIAVNHDHAHK